MNNLNGIMPLKFIYAHPPAWILTIPYEQRAWTLAAQRAYVQAQQQNVVLSSAWHPRTECHHLWRRSTPLLMRAMGNYLDYQEPARLKVLL
jgi:hypothetical protein